MLVAPPVRTATTSPSPQHPLLYRHPTVSRRETEGGGEVSTTCQLWSWYETNTVMMI